MSIGGTSEQSTKFSLRKKSYFPLYSRKFSTTLGSVLPQSPVSSAPQSLVEVVGPTLQSWSAAMNPGVVAAVAPAATPPAGAPGMMGAVVTSAPHWKKGEERRQGKEGGGGGGIAQFQTHD